MSRKAVDKQLLKESWDSQWNQALDEKNIKDIRDSQQPLIPQQQIAAAAAAALLPEQQQKQQQQQQQQQYEVVGIEDETVRRQRKASMASLLQNTVMQEIGQQRLAQQELRILRVHGFNCLMVLIGLVCAVIENELSYTGDMNFNDPYHYKQIMIIMKAVVLLTTILLVAGVIFYHVLLLPIKSRNSNSRQQEKSMPNTVLLQTPTSFLALEIFIIAFVIPPGVDKSITMNFLAMSARYRLEVFGILLMLFRLYLFVRAWRDRQAIKLKKALPLLHHSGLNLNTTFIVKRALDEYPLQMYGVTVFSIIILAAYALRMGEIKLQKGGGDFQYTEHKYYWNNMWLIVVTIATVGFGDTYPKSHIGRVVCVISLIISIVFVSLMTANLSSAIGYSAVERRVANAVNKQDWRKDRMLAAAGLIQAWWKDVANDQKGKSDRLAAMRERFQKANRRYMRAIQSEANVEKVMNSIIDQLASIEKVVQSQSNSIRRTEENVRNASRGLENRFSAFEGRISALRCGVKSLNKDIEPLRQLNKKLQEIHEYTMASEILCPDVNEIDDDE